MIELLGIRGYNFLTYKSLKLRFKGGKSFYVEGNNLDDPSARSNASGKTLIFHAVTWPLYGRMLDGTEGDDIIGEHDEWTFMEDKFRKDGDIYKIRRYRNHPQKGDQLFVFRNEENITLHTNEETEKWIEGFFGLSFTGWLYAVYFGSDPNRQFTLVQDSTRKKVLTDILRLDALANGHEKVKARLLRLTQEKVLADQEIANAVEAIESEKQSIESIEAQKKVSETASTSRKEKHEARISELEVEKSEVLIKLKEFADFDKKELANGIREIFETKKKGIEDEIKPLMQKRDEIISESSRLNFKVQAAERARKLLSKGENARCPECRQTISESHVQDLEEKAKEARTELGKLRAETEEIDAKIASGRTATTRLEQEQSDMLVKLEKRVSSLRKLEAEISSIDERIASEKEAMKEQASADFDGLLEKAREKKKQAEQREEEARVQLKKISKKESALKLVETAFGPNGVRKLIFQSALEIVNRQATYYLDRITDGGFQVEIGTEKELKGGGVREGIPIYIHRKGKKRLLRTFSDGQKAKLRFAIDYAAQRLVASNIGFVVIDERTVHIDDRGIHRIMTLLKEEWQTRGKMIFVLGHDPVSKSYMDRTVAVTLSNETSSAEIV